MRLRWLRASAVLATLACAAALGAAPGAADEPAAPTEGASVLDPGGPGAARPGDRRGVPVTSREEYVDGRLQLDGETRKMEIRGRGNSTWNWPKKPYKIQLAKDAALVGGTAQEEWVLLANYADRSALRTAAAFAIAARTGLAWTPKSRYVDVTLNGQPLGLYLLTEQVEQGKNRVELPDNGYLLEINERYARDDEPGFRSRQGTPVAFKDPDEINRRQRHQVRRGVRKFEDVLYGQNFADPKTGYRAYVDVGSFVDWYLVEELFGNQDSNFRSSVNVSWTPGGKFVMGPVWDFDLSAGSRWLGSVPPQGWFTRTGRHWIARMLQDPVFSARVMRRWMELRPVVDEVVAQIPTAAESLRASAEIDWAQWHTGAGARPGSAHADSFVGEVAFLKDWLAQKAVWMTRPQVTLGQVPVTVPERDQVVWIPVRLTGAVQGSVSVAYEWIEGTATRGVDLSVPEDELVFAPGETVRYLPVRVLPDALPEAAESIGLRLKGGGSDVIVGAPDLLTVTIGASDQPVDALVRQARDRQFVGDDVFAPDGRGQTLVARARRGDRRVFVVRVVNDGTVRNTVRVRAETRGQAVRVRYLRGRNDVTGRVTEGKGLRLRLDPGEHRQVRVVVRVWRGADKGDRGRALVRAVWRGDETRVDAVVARVRVRR